MRVEILGYFGSGKTFLANRLSKLGVFECVSEDHLSIPNWGSDTISGEIPSLSYELLFLIQHNLLLNNSDNEKYLICDWSFVTDRIWANSRLSKKDMDAYQSVYSRLSIEHSDLVIYVYLDVSSAVIESRLQTRGRLEETSLAKGRIESALTELRKSVALIDPNTLICVEYDDSIQSIHERLIKKIHSYR